MTQTNVHASCVVLARAAAAFGAPQDAGILLLGPSGAGKSALALRLLALGATLVADDRVELFAREGELWACPPARLAGLLEVRGLGVVRQPHVREARIALVVRLGKESPRMPEGRSYAPPHPLALDRPPPLLDLSAGDAAVTEKIILATAAFADALFREEGNPL
jgi:hypothetical protein